MYVAPVETEGQPFQKQFQQSFRMPYASFQELVEMAKTQENDKLALLLVNQADAPQKPLVSRMWLMLDVIFVRDTYILVESHCLFFELFVFGRKFLYPKFLVAPQGRGSC
jgi:hypothetical protein